MLNPTLVPQDECNGYGFEVDAWACGVIMYTLLIGRPPFWHRKQMMLIRQIMRGEYTMVGPDWADVTSETKDLVGEQALVTTCM
jgi:serine/threonine protein kinase